MESNFKADYAKLDDKGLKKIFKPPYPGKEFSAYWLHYVRSACVKDGFGVWHLKNIEILCTLYIEYDRMTSELDEFYKDNGGYTYHSTGRNGYQVKTHSLVSDRKSILGDIRSYSKMLGLELSSKPVDMSNDDDDEEVKEWKG